MFFKSVSFLRFAAPLLLALFIPAVMALESNKELETITKLTAVILGKQHFKQRPIDAKLSAELYEEYFKALDPNKIYFSKEDLARFSDYKLKQGEMIARGDLEFAFKLYEFYAARIEEHNKFADSLIDKGFDFAENESFMINRSKADWPENYAELKKLWRLKVKNDLLSVRLMDRAAKEKEHEKELGKNKAQKIKAPDKDKEKEKENASVSSGAVRGFKDRTKDKDKDKDKDKENASVPPPHPSWSGKSPEERLKKRYAQFLNFVKKNDSVDALEIYLSSLARVYDPHSAYMSPRSEEDFNIGMKLSLVGIGAVLSSDDGYTKVVKIIQGGPADLDGKLKAEDRIIAVCQDGGEPVDVIDMPLSKVVSLIRGKPNTKVHLTVLEGAKGVNAIPKIITINRDTVKLKDQEASGKIKSVKTADGVKKFGVITLPSFYMDFDAAHNGDSNFKSSTSDVKKILDDFKKEKISGLVIDLRSNGGGSLVEAVKLSGLFIKEGPVVQVKNNPGELEIKSDVDPAVYYTGPMVILLNKLSASAAEIFAGAMRDYNRAVLVGDAHTHGKGTVQTVFDLNQFLGYLGVKFPSGSVKFTNAVFYRVNGSSTQLKGITPDVVFPSFTDYMEVGEEDLPHALAWDQISPVAHDDYNGNVGDAAGELSRLSASRRAQNPKFKLLEEDIKIFAKRKDQKEISLNEEARWSEYQNEKKIHDEQKKVMRFDADTGEESRDGDAKGDQSDLYLDETLNILADYISLTQPKPAPAAAKNTPK